MCSAPIRHRSQCVRTSCINRLSPAPPCYATTTIIKRRNIIMVRHLISALSSLIEDDNACAAACDDDSSTTVLKHSLLVRIGTAIKLPRIVSPIQNSRRQHLFDTPPSSAPLSPERRSMPSRVIGSITSSFATLMSPQRRKNRHSLDDDAQATSAAIPVTSPRNGMDNKRSRTLPRINAAITNSMEWGRCHLEEFVQFSGGDHFVFILPADHRNDSKQSTIQRKAIRDRMVKSVATVLADHSSPDVYWAPHRTLTNAARNKEAHEHLMQHHGIVRNKKVYIELRCCLHRYPHRDDFTKNIIPRNEILNLFRQNEGVYIRLLDYDNHELHIRWNEVPFIQLWQMYSRLDHRPPISIQSERGTAKYVIELMSFYNAYKDDNQYLLRQLRDAQSENSTLLRESEHVTNIYNSNILRDKMTDKRLPEFNAYADTIYYNAWVDHYSGFQPNAPLLDSAILNNIYKTVESTFPMHMGSLRSMMFGKRSTQPKRANTQYNLNKRHVLVHYFFCLLRERTVTTSYIGQWLVLLHCIIVVPILRRFGTLSVKPQPWILQLHFIS